MKKITRRNFLAITGAAAATTLVACSSDSSSSTATTTTTTSTASTSSSDASADITFRFSWWGSEVRHEATLAAIEAYQASNPGITIESEYSSYDGYQEKLMSQVAAGNPPAIYTSVTEWYPTLYEAGAMADITGSFDMSGHGDAIIEACSYNGAVYGVSTSLNAHGFTYNVTLADELGITIPTEGYTWDDLMDLGLEAYEKSGGTVYGFLDVRQTGEALPVFGYTVWGKEFPYMWSDTELTVTAEDFQAYQEYFESQPEGVLLPPEESFVVEGMTYAPVAHRDTLFDSCSLGTFSIFQSQTEDVLSVLPFPKGANGEQGDAARPGLIQNIYSGESDEVIAACVDFLDWFTNSEEAALILGISRGVLPTDTQREAVLNAEGYLTDDDMVYIDAINAIYEYGDMKAFLAGPAGCDQILSSVIKAVSEEVAFGLITPEESGPKFIESCNFEIGL